MLLAGLKRKEDISKLKDDIMGELIKTELKDKRSIIFAGSIEQAELYSGNSVHSKKSKKQNDAIIEAFQNKHINQIYAFKKLTEGMNFKDIDACLIVQLDVKDLTFIQKMGRALRSKMPEVYVIVIKNTSDERNWRNVSNVLDEKYIFELD
jgi:superfamily II DNA or RNA helicase